MRFCLLFLLMFSIEAFAQNLSVLTWNTFLVPPPVNSTKQEERANLIANKLKTIGDDIIFFQEAFMDSKREQIIHELASVYPYVAIPKKGHGLFQLTGSGLFIVSKYPMKVLDQVVFDDCADSDCLASKSAIMVELTIPDGHNEKTIQMINTHLQAWNGPQEIAIRKKQLLQIKEMMSNNAKVGVAQVLVGDLNINGKLEAEYINSLILMEMTSAHLEGRLDSSNGFSTSDCFENPGGSPEGEWIDHMWLNSNGTDTEIHAKKIVPILGLLGTKLCPLSDHHAVRAQIEVKQNNLINLAKGHSAKVVKISKS